MKQAAAAEDHQVGRVDGVEHAADVAEGERLDAVALAQPAGIGRVGGNDEAEIRAPLAQAAHQGGEDGLVPGVAVAVIADDEDPLAGHGQGAGAKGVQGSPARMAAILSPAWPSP